MTEVAQKRVETIVFEISDNEKFKPIWDMLRNEDNQFGARYLIWHRGDRITEIERRLNVWEHFCGGCNGGELMDREFSDLYDELKEQHGWKDDEWSWSDSVNAVACVWQPEGVL